MSTNSDETSETRFRSVDEVYELLWKAEVEDEDGNLSEEKVKAVLYSFGALLNNITHVYGYITEGKVTDPLAEPATVMEAADEFTISTLDDGIATFVQQIIDTAKQIDDPENRLRYIEATFDAVIVPPN